jgi:hypothetical protein
VIPPERWALDEQRIKTGLKKEHQKGHLVLGQTCTNVAISDKRATFCLSKLWEDNSEKIPRKHGKTLKKPVVLATGFSRGERI